MLPRPGSPTPVPDASADPDLTVALFAEAARKSDVGWVTWESDGRTVADRLLWHTWHDDALLLVVDGDEQPAPGLAAAGTARVTLRAKDSRARLVSLPCRVHPLSPDDPAWGAAVAALAAARLNLRDADPAATWADRSAVLRLSPAPH